MSLLLCIRTLRNLLYRATVGIAFAKNQTIKAYEIVGSALDTNARVTNRVLTVKHLLSPLTREEVGVVRCLGLNYADHAAEANMQKPA